MCGRLHTETFFAGAYCVGSFIFLLSSKVSTAGEGGGGESCRPAKTFRQNGKEVEGRQTKASKTAQPVTAADRFGAHLLSDDAGNRLACARNSGVARDIAR